MTKCPNILVFLTDDHARWALGCYGNPAIRTPTLDYLARTGARMENAFTPNPVCSPARASFLTGLTPSQHGIHDFLGNDAHPGINGFITLPQLLQQAGYRTALFGKWHLGHEENAHPGFDRCFSLGPDYPYVHQGPHRYFDQGRPKLIAGFMTDVIADEVLANISDSHDSQPLFLLVTFMGTHSPWVGHPEHLVNTYRSHDFKEIQEGTTYPHGGLLDELIPPGRQHPQELRAQYYASVEHIDRAVGRIVNALSSRSMLNETVVIYTADHGLNLGQHGIWGKANSTIPSNMVEETIRIPMIISYPNEIRPSIMRGEMVDLMDLFSTILDYAEVTLPRDLRSKYAYPGRSFRELASGRYVADWKDLQFSEYGHLRMARSRSLKLVRRYPDGPNELFDLRHDPSETTNLFSDLRYAEAIAGLSERMEAYFSGYEDPNRSGLFVRQGPIHNDIEPWREGWREKYESDYRT